MSWLWFLPALFLFDIVYVLVCRLNLPTDWISLPLAVAAVFALSFSSSVLISVLGWTGWTKTPLIDFQNERLLPYFLFFLLGSLCYRLRVFDTDKRNMKLFVIVNATAWIPVNIYVIAVLNYILRPGTYLISESGDMLLLWFGFHLSLLALLYCAVATFRYFFNNQRRIGRELAGLSYGVYIIHVAVLGPIALALLGIDAPGLVKYPILAAATWVVSNFIVFVYARTFKKRFMQRAVTARPTHVMPAQPLR